MIAHDFVHSSQIPPHCLHSPEVVENKNSSMDCSDYCGLPNLGLHLSFGNSNRSNIHFPLNK
jgi:hypothetical protein